MVMLGGTKVEPTVTTRAVAAWTGVVGASVLAIIAVRAKAPAPRGDRRPILVSRVT
jgi:hypothetical protein